MIRSRWARLLAVFTALLLVLGACGGRDDDSADTTTTTAPAGDNGDNGDDNGDEPAGDPEAARGFDGTTIRLGVLTPTSGQVAIIGNPLTAGNQAYFDYVNEELGGIAGKYPVELVIEDTAYDPTTAGQRYAAIREDVALILQVLGTPVTNALIPDFIDDDMLAAPASLDSAWVREPNLIPVGGPYQTQAMNGVDWYYSQAENEGDVFCTLASDDEYGDTGVEGAEFAAENLGIDIAAQASFPAPSATRPAQTFEAQLSQLQGANCDVILFVATATDTAGLTTALSESAYNPIVLGQSPAWLTPFATFEFLQTNFFLLSEGGDYGDESIPGMAELVRIKDTYAPDQAPDLYFNFGYLQAMAVHQLLEAAVANGDLSAEGLMSALESIDLFEFDGLLGDYSWGSAEDRVPPANSSIFRPNPDAPMGMEVVAQDHQAPYADDLVFE